MNKKKKKKKKKKRKEIVKSLLNCHLLYNTSEDVHNTNRFLVFVILSFFAAFAAPTLGLTGFFSSANISFLTSTISFFNNFNTSRLHHGPVTKITLFQ